MRVAYVDMVGGAAGDMLMAAWVDAGLDVGALERALRTVVADGWELVTERVLRCGIAATHLDLVIPGEDDHAHGAHRDEHEPGAHRDEHERGAHRHEHEHGAHDHAHRRESEHGGRYLRDILAIVENSGLTPGQIERASRIYRRLADAEARVHGVDADQVHFHEVGQVDAILDVAGTCVALDLLGIDEIRTSAFPYGHGLARMHHGTYPTPSPATVELLRGLPLRATDMQAELVTVTGAAILSTLATSFDRRPTMTLERVGYGAGRRELAIPNVVRVLIGETSEASNGVAPTDDGDDVLVIEANIDDFSPQHYELAFERLFAAGALDVWMTPIVMKKGRPATVLAALARPGDEDAIARTLLRETSTIGVRVRRERRHVLARTIDVVETPYGPVRFKRVSGDGVERDAPEYDDVARIARERGLPIAEVTRVVVRAAETVRA